jgi:hypothetical protein
MYAFRATRHFPLSVALRGPPKSSVLNAFLCDSRCALGSLRTVPELSPVLTTEPGCRLRSETSRLSQADLRARRCGYSAATGPNSEPVEVPRGGAGLKVSIIAAAPSPSRTEQI